MKKRIHSILFGALFVVAGVFSFSPDEANAKMLELAESGKWVAVYQGGSTVKFCECLGSLTHADCKVGDTTTKTSKCD